MEKILNLKGETFGYASPERVLFAVILGGEWVKTYPAFKRYVKKATPLIKAYTHFSLDGEVYDMSEKGCEEAISAKYGAKKEIKILNTSQYQWESKYCRILGSTKEGLELLPTVVVGGQLYAALDYKEAGRYVGDNVDLTGGPKPYGEKAKGTKVPFYHQTFSAGSGKVTAGIEGCYSIPEEVKVFAASSEYA